MDNSVWYKIQCVWLLSIYINGIDHRCTQGNIIGCYAIASNGINININIYINIDIKIDKYEYKFCIDRL